MRYCLAVLFFIAVLMRVAPCVKNERDMEATKGIELFTTYSPFIWIPTNVRGPRHSRYVRARHSFLLFSGLRRRGLCIILLMLLLSGDVELNLGPSSDENATTSIATSTRSSSGKTPNKDAVSVAVKTMKKKGKCVCPICDEPIIDKSSRKDGQNSVFCEGQCQAWLHKHCASLSSVAFQAVSQSQASFYCPHCHLDHLGKEIATMKATVLSLVSELENVSKMLGKTSKSKKSVEVEVESCGNATISSQKADVVTQSSDAKEAPVGTSSSSSVVSHNYQRKFNVVVLGVPECPKGTHRSARATHDLSSVSSFLSKVESSITTQSISDIYRLGKYSETSQRPRPVLVKFSRLLDATIILSKRSSIKGSALFVKPDLSPSERETESILLRQRWSLIQSGTDRQSIKIRGSRLFSNGRLHGQVIDSSYVTRPLLSDYVPQSLNTSSDHLPQLLNASSDHLPKQINTSSIPACDPNKPSATNMNSTETDSEDLSNK